MHPKPNDRGSALITVLVIAVIITATLMVFLSFSVQHARMLTHKGDFLKARYTAQNGLQQFIADAHQDDNWDWRREITTNRFNFDAGDTATVETTPWGSYTYVRSSAARKDQQSTITDYLAIVPPPIFNNALILNPLYSSLVVTGDTRLQGDVIVGRSGVKKESLRGRPYSGSSIVYGNIERSTIDQRPGIDREFLRSLFSGLNRDSRRTAALDLQALLPDSGYRVQLTATSGMPQIIDFTEGLPTEDPWEITGPGILVANSPLTLSGNLSFRNHVKILSQHPITIGPGVTMDGAIVYSAKHLTLDSVTQLNGQFYSEEKIEVKGHSSIEYPSIALVFAPAPGSSIKILDNAIFNGTMAGIRREPDASNTPEAGHVWVDDNAIVNGLLYSDNTVTLEGTVKGTLITDRFHFYYSPTNYYNWINGGRIDRNSLDGDFRLPLFFKVPHSQLSTLGGLR